ncbi:cytochrome P450 family 806A-CYP806A1 [Chondrus crispus]|uniref:Cytochrome P450 family 806A-CYP806A1 n=1 Tax=Chondrus crispus TaxID=2769 RepID=R7Q4X7_CHOCR|nr:cytochrome P450 family 806A-CYP806A1 [Chondrus crispus]CDF33597.1 cytochrome P450 family 806A-CYP806A1 [Chondrus crispus]|eukprot:XP_005713400.1 cytochrome P450 family 806A-CYP806A1 [Chondrus crispus]
MSNSRNYLDRWTPPGFQLLLYDGNLRGLVFSQGRYWMQHRKVVGSVFRSPDFLNHYVETVIDKTAFLIHRLWQPKAGTVLNVHQEMRMLTLDIIGAAAFGTEFGAMTSTDGTHEIETCLSNILHGVLDVITSPVPLWRVMRTPGRAAIENDLNRLQQIELRLIQKRREELRREGTQPEDTSKKDLLGLLLRARDSSRSANFKDEDLMWDVHDVIFAGHETTASALAAALFLIAGKPRVLRNIQQELEEVLPEGRTPTIEDISKLKYLDMVLNESLRLYPPTALIGRCAKAEDTIAGYDIPAGANILMSPYVMGRLEQLWDNPEEFRPERFSPEEVAKRHPMSHTPFGAGPRVCLGARMATMEAKVVLAMIFQKFSFERTQDKLEVDYDSTVSFKSGMDMVIRRVP